MTETDYLPLFVYGTLRRGGINYCHYLQGKTLRVEPAVTQGALHLSPDGWYPYLTTGDHPVTGDLIWFNPELFSRQMTLIDRLEEYDPANEQGSLYLRRRTVATDDSGSVLCWIYYVNPRESLGPPIASGDFFEIIPPAGSDSSFGE